MHSQVPAGSHRHFILVKALASGALCAFAALSIAKAAKGRWRRVVVIPAEFSFCRLSRISVLKTNDRTREDAMNFNISKIAKFGAVLAPLVCAATSAGVLNAQAQNYSQQQLDVFDRILPLVCGYYQPNGDSKTIELNGTAKAELSSLFKKLADLGIEGAGKLDVEEYSGVLRNQIGPELKDVRDCRLKVFTDLQGQLSNPSKASVD